MWKKLTLIIGGIIIFPLVTAADCGSPVQNSQSAQQAAQTKAETHAPYIPKNDVEFNNYNQRMKVSDDPTTIWWCTSAFPIPSSPLFTVPILGKLTSGSKRPYSTSQATTNTGTTYSPELPGPDGMFGSSGEYRYGFTPGGVYVDFYNLATFCTTEPSVWQRQDTKITLGTDSKLLAAQQQAQAILARHTPATAADKAEAEAILVAAINGR